MEGGRYNNVMGVGRQYFKGINDTTFINVMWYIRLQEKIHQGSKEIVFLSKILFSHFVPYVSDMMQ